MESNVHGPRGLIYAKSLFAGLNFIYETLDGVWNRRPAFYAILTKNYMKDLVMVLYENPLKLLTKNGNPQTSSVVRDVLLVYGVGGNVKNKQLISTEKFLLQSPDGSKEYIIKEHRFDEYSLIGTIVRGGGKIGFLYIADSLQSGLNSTFTSINYYGVFDNQLDYISKDKYAVAARFGNYIMEPISILLNIIIPKDRQFEGNTHIAWYLYIFSGFKMDWLYKAVVGAVARANIPDQMGEFYKWAKDFKFIKNSAYHLEVFKNKAISHFFNVNEPDSNVKTWEQIAQINEKSDATLINELLADATMLTWSYFFKLLDSIIQGYIIVIPANEAFRCVENGLKEYGVIKTSAITFGLVGAYLGINTLTDKVENYFELPSIALVIKESADSSYLFIEEKVCSTSSAIYELIIGDSATASIEL